MALLNEGNLPDRQPDPGGTIFQDDAQGHAWIQPMSFNENTGHSNSLKVGWTLRTRKNDKWQIIEGYAFKINPQGLSRQLGSRTQLAAVKGGFYVDDFGPGPTALNLRQLVAGGKTTDDGVAELLTPREDVQRFLKRIYLPAISNVDRVNKVQVWFHDNHFERGYEEQVFFPANSLSIERDVSLHNVWRIEVQMVGLGRRPYAQVDVDKTPTTGQGATSRIYVVVRGDTLDRIISRLLGKANKNSPSKRKAALVALEQLNPWLSKSRTVRIDNKPVAVKPFKLVPGDRLRVPA